MDDIKVGPAIPAHLQHRVNQIVRIDDILDGKTASPNESVDENVTNIQFRLIHIYINWMFSFCRHRKRKLTKL